jgi:hypothetical protein
MSDRPEASSTSPAGLVDELFPELRTATGGNDLRRKRGLIRLASIAQEHAQAEADGDKNPTKLLAERHGVATPTVRSWLHRARCEGLTPGSHHPNATLHRASEPKAIRSLVDVQGRCPACGSTSLFLGDGGYVTCPRIDCPEPDAASTLLGNPQCTAETLYGHLRRRCIMPVRHASAHADGSGLRWSDHFSVSLTAKAEAP